jgi:hypothetical protein
MPLPLLHSWQIQPHKRTDGSVSFRADERAKVELRKDLKRPARSSSPWNTLQTTQTNVQLANRKDTTTLGFWEAQVYR